MSKLKSHFQDCWSQEKSSSIKLKLFYNSYKHSFSKEPYLDLVTNPAFRFTTTRLRISAHDLHIESGRYTKTPREDRLCKWCKLTMGEQQVETEEHFLFSCDLYATLRRKMISSLSKTTIILTTPTSGTCEREGREGARWLVWMDGGALNRDNARSLAHLRCCLSHTCSVIAR